MRQFKSLLVVLLATVGFATAATAQIEARHEVKAIYSTSNAWQVKSLASFGNVSVMNKKQGSKTNTKSIGMVGLGYRYHLLDRVKVGVDFGFAPEKETFYQSAKESKATKSYNVYRMVALPTVDFTYWQNDWVNVYGSASAGLMLAHRSVKGDKKAKAEMVKSFAYQVNPVGVRIGNNLIGGFIELGYGSKGLVSAGLSLQL